MRGGMITMVSLLTVTLGIKAQTPQAFKAGPLGFLIGVYNLRYERGLQSNTSFQVGANYYDFKLFGVATTGYGLDGAYRYYYTEALKGIYIAPSMGLAFNKTYVSKTSNIQGNFSYLNLGATIGYQWASSNRVLTDIGLGYGYNVELEKDESLLSSYSFPLPKFTLALGFMF